MSERQAALSEQARCACLVRVLLQKILQATDGRVPLRGDLLLALARLRQASGLELPDALAPLLSVLDQARVGQRVQVLGDTLACDRRALAQARDRERLARLCTSATPAAAAFRRRARQTAVRLQPASAPSYAVTCFSMFWIWPSQPPSFMRNASARRAAGMRSKPDSVIVSRVPPAAGSSWNSTNVVGSFE